MSRLKATDVPTAKNAANAVQRDCLIAAIGASAGGLEALTALLQFLPANTGLAFVLVQHLDPHHESMLVQLLSRSTTMKVLEAKTGIAPAPDHVYVIPPNRVMTISDGRLVLAKRQQNVLPHMPVDAFFNALSKDAGRRAIGIVLSGGGSDGAAGLQAIRAEGGITLAQNEASARQPGMPHSAIATGCVDLVLTPEEIGKELARIARHPYAREAKDGAGIEDSLFAGVTRALRAAAGVDFSGYRQSTIVRRINRRMALHEVANLETYVSRLQDDEDEARALCEDILIHVTGFFRDEDAFAALKEQIAPLLAAGRPGTEPIRVWVAGCSTGEEVYSIAILLLECRGRGQQPAFQIFGTDLSERSIERARAGVYPDSALAGMAPDRLKRFFVKTRAGYQISKLARDLCVFAQHDVTKDPPFSNMDFISCRNVLIYMGAELQKRVFAIFHYALKAQGRLMLGKSESPGNSSLFTLEDRKNRIYTRKSSALHGTFPLARVRATEKAISRTIREATPAFDLTRTVDRLLATHYVPAAMLVDSELQILQFHGDTSPYLRPAQGGAALQLMKMVREELVVYLRMLLRRARQEDGRVSKAGIRLQLGDQVREVTVEVIPVPGRQEKDADFLIVFLETKQSTPLEVVGGGTTKRGQKPDMERLREELSATREFLQSAMEAAEVSNEELRAANEEILSNNEELQSTNEELETAKEQLQSTNEELTTLNEELQTRNTELAQVNSDLNNLLLNAHVPMVILDADSRIRHFAPAAGNLFNVMAGDIGRRISDIQPNFDWPELNGLIASVMNNGLAAQREVKDRGGKWHSLRVHPYRSGERVDGALLAALDVDRIKRTLDEAQAARDYAAVVVETTHEPLVVLDEDLRVFSANGAFCTTFQLKQQDVTGRLLLELGDGEWNIPSLRGILLDVLRSGVPVEGMELTHGFRTIGRKIMMLNVRPVLNVHGLPHLVLLALDDVTARRLSEEELQDSEALFRALFETSSRAILGVNKKGEIVFANPATELMFGYGSLEITSRGIEDLMPPRFRRGHAAFRAGYFSSPPRSMGPNPEIMGLRKDGSEFPIEVYLASVSTRDGMLSVAFVDDVTARKAAEKSMHETEVALRQSQEHLRRLTSGLFRAQEEERRRISRELHDDLNQRLASLVMEVETVEHLLPASSTQVRKSLEKARRSVEQISDGVRRAAYQLHPSILEHLGLVAALKSLCADFQVQHRLKVTFRNEGPPHNIPMEAAICLYRVAQESLRNVVKHSGQNAARVTLVFAESIIHLIVEDAGAGLPAEPENGRSGLGIVSMEERVRLAGGTLEIRSQRGVGTRLEAMLPIRQTSADSGSESE